MKQPSTIQIFSADWFFYTIICILFMGLIILASRYLTQKGNYSLRLSLAILYISSVLLIHPLLFSINQWHYQTSLPFHMCELSEIFAAIVLIWPNQRLFEILCYWGIPGGIHSILTPELVHAGEEPWLMVHYYIQHTGIILVPIWLMSTFQMRLSRQSWLKVFFISNLFIPVVGTINWLINANYMFLAQKPLAENPLIIGDWPWYILILDIIMLGHFYVVYFFCTQKFGLLTVSRHSKFYRL